MVTVAKQENKAFYKSFKSLFGTTNHKEIGILYLVFSLLNLVIGGTFALLIRYELFNPAEGDLEALPILGDIIKVSGGNNVYTQLFTMHGTIMIFLVIFPLAAGFGNYLVPILIGAEDMYWPRWNNAAFWLIIPGALFIYLGMPWHGWYSYAPLSLENGAFGPNNINFWAVGLLFLGVSSVAAAMNFIMTIFTMRKPGLTMGKLDLFTWGILITSFIQLMATPIITTALLTTALDRLFGASFYSAQSIGGGPLLFQHIFWAYSHPAVYIMLIPAMGATSYLIAKFARKEIFGYTAMVISMIAITVLGFMVWGHHIYVAGEGNVVHQIFFIMTALIAIPSVIKMFNWLMTLRGANIKFDAPLLFTAGWLFGFALGGVTGIFLNVIPLDYFLQDTYWVIGHFHYVVIGGTVTTFMGLIYYLFPFITGKMYNTKIAFWHWLLWVSGYTITFGSMLVLGMLGMPRRYYAYTYQEWTMWNQFATIGAFMMGLAGLLFAINLIYYGFKGKEVEDKNDPFGVENPDITPPAEGLGH